MTRTWQVTITLIVDGEPEVHSATVLATTAADAAVVLGDRLRTERGVKPGDMLGVEEVHVTRVSDELRRLAINRDQVLKGGSPE